MELLRLAWCTIRVVCNPLVYHSSCVKLVCPHWPWVHPPLGCFRGSPSTWVGSPLVTQHRRNRHWKMGAGCGMKVVGGMRAEGCEGEGCGVDGGCGLWGEGCEMRFVGCGLWEVGPMQTHIPYTSTQHSHTHTPALIPACI